MAMTQQDYDALPAEGKEQLRKLAEAAMAFPWKDKSQWPKIPVEASGFARDIESWLCHQGVTIPYTTFRAELDRRDSGPFTITHPAVTKLIDEMRGKELRAWMDDMGYDE